jgi:hypothetical protein
MMNRTVLIVTYRLVVVSAVVCLASEAVAASTSKDIMHSALSGRCFHSTELNENIATLKQQAGADVAKVSGFLLTKARTANECRTEVVQALISGLAQATNPTTNQYQNFFFWLHGANLLADLKATEALDLLIANIDFTDGWSASIRESHFPALVAILRIGQPAIPKLQIVLTNDPESDRRKFAAFAIAYIGGSQARKTLTSALQSETDSCVKNFVRLSIQAFDNKTKPNHISSELNGKWLSAFYCR